MHDICLTSDCQRSSGSVVTHCKSDYSWVSFSDASEREAMCLTLGLDQVHFIILQWDILEFPLGQRCLLMRHQTLKMDIFTLVHDAALQEFQNANLDLCLINIFQQSSYTVCFSDMSDKAIAVQSVNKVWLNEYRYVLVCYCEYKWSKTVIACVNACEERPETGKNDDMKSVMSLNRKVFVWKTVKQEHTGDKKYYYN